MTKPWIYLFRDRDQAEVRCWPRRPHAGTASATSRDSRSHATASAPPWPMPASPSPWSRNASPPRRRRASRAARTGGRLPGPAARARADRARDAHLRGPRLPAGRDRGRRPGHLPVHQGRRRRRSRYHDPAHCARQRARRPAARAHGRRDRQARRGAAWARSCACSWRSVVPLSPRRSPRRRSPSRMTRSAIIDVCHASIATPRVALPAASRCPAWPRPTRRRARAAAPRNKPGNFA